MLMRHAAKHAKKNIAVSEATRHEIIDHLHVDQNKIVVTYEGIDTAVFSNKDSDRTVDKPYFLYVGMHILIKILINYFAHLSSFCLTTATLFLSWLERKIIFTKN